MALEQWSDPALVLGTRDQLVLMITNFRNATRLLWLPETDGERDGA
jgi:hypothetical protein